MRMELNGLKIFMVLIAVLASFSGCVGKKKLTQEEEEFWANESVRIYRTRYKALGGG